MKRLILSFWCLILIVTSLCPMQAKGQRRAVHRPVVVRRPIVRTRLVVRHGHPIRRVLPANVVVRAARRTVVVNHPLVYLPALAWRAAVVSLPPN
jgi:hypothetical protein